MIIYQEVNPLPKRCIECTEVKEYGIDAACAECDYALDRFIEIKEES